MSGSQWTEVKDEMESAEWSPDAVVALIQWIPSLTKDTIPSVLREALLTSSTSSPVIGSDPRALVELAGEHETLECFHISIFSRDTQNGVASDICAIHATYRTIFIWVAHLLVDHG